MKEFIQKNKKSVIIASIMLAIIHISSLTICLIPGINNGAWDIYLYLDYMATFTIVLLCVMLIYREWKINSIRKKSKNYVDPLKDEEKAQYKTFVNSVLYTVFVSAIVYFVVATTYYMI